MLNLFKHQWLPNYIREYIVKKFPTENVALSQLEQFNEELELALMVENKHEPELDEEG